MACDFCRRSIRSGMPKSRSIPTICGRCGASTSAAAPAWFLPGRSLVLLGAVASGAAAALARKDPGRGIGRRRHRRQRVGLCDESRAEGQIRVLHDRCRAIADKTTSTAERFTSPSCCIPAAATRRHGRLQFAAYCGRQAAIARQHRAAANWRYPIPSCFVITWYSCTAGTASGSRRKSASNCGCIWSVAACCLPMRSARAATSARRLRARSRPFFPSTSWSAFRRAIRCSPANMAATILAQVARREPAARGPQRAAQVAASRGRALSRRTEARRSLCRDLFPLRYQLRPGESRVAGVRRLRPQGRSTDRAERAPLFAASIGTSHRRESCCRWP